MDVTLKLTTVKRMVLSDILSVLAIRRLPHETREKTVRTFQLVIFITNSSTGIEPATFGL